MRLVVRFQKLGETDLRHSEVTVTNLSHLIKLLGSYGYHVVQYFEKKPNEQQIMVPLGRRVR